MRRAAKTDRNHQEIVDALRKVGASVYSTHAVGQGFPDVVCGFRGLTFCIEIKDGDLPPSQRGLTDAQLRFRIMWQGHYAIANNVDEALKIIGAK